MKNIIYRSVDNNLSIDEDSRLITGQAVVFESWSRDLGGFTEIIHQGAITQELVDNSDVIMNIDHDPSKMVARSHMGQGTLELELKEDGLYFSFEAPTTALGDELLYNVRKGNLFECSFAFSLPNNDTCQKWVFEGDTAKREIFEIGGLYDCAVVINAAYGATSVSARNENSENIDVNSIKEEIEKREQEEKDKLIKDLEMKMDEINLIDSYDININ